ncbi:MAG: NUDIX hydrolase [Bacteroidota bacterium]
MPIPKTLKSELRYHGRVFDLIVEEIEYPSGRTTTREIAMHNGGCVVVPILDDGSILLVRQYRHPLKQYILELPAGKLEANENPLDCASRELREETGYEAASIEKLTDICTTPGFCSEVLHIYLATGLRHSPKGQALEEGEATLTLETYSLVTAVAMIERGEISDSKTICGILLAEKKIQKKQCDKK